MKKILFIAAFMAAAIITRAQNSVIFCAQTNCPITITNPTDSALIFGQGTITGLKDSVITYLWKQVSGPSAAVIVSPTASQTMIRKLVPGAYTFSMTVTSKLGASQTISNDLVTVLPAPAPARTVKSISFTLVNGLWIPSITYSDGSTQ